MGNRNFLSEECFNNSALFNEYIDGELDEGARRAFEEHLEACPDCAADFDRFRSTVQAVRMSARRPQRSVADAVMAQVGAKGAARPRRQRHVPVATLIALAAVVTIVAMNRDAFAFFGNSIKNSTARNDTARQFAATTEYAQGDYSDAAFGTMADSGERMGIDAVPPNNGFVASPSPAGVTPEAGEAAKAAVPEATTGSKQFAIYAASGTGENPQASEGEPGTETVTSEAEQPGDTNADGFVREQMYQLGNKIKLESGFETPVSATYMINTSDDELQQALLEGFLTHEDKGMLLISSSYAGALERRIAGHLELSWFSFVGEPQADEIVVIFY